MVAKLEGGDVGVVLVGAEGGVAVAGLAVEDRELGAGMGSLAADDQPCALGPAGEVELVGQLCALGALAHVAVAIDRAPPARFGQLRDRPAHPLVDLVANREVDPCRTAALREGVGAPADVGASEDLAVKVGLGQLLKRQLQHLEVIGRGAARRPAARLSRLGSGAAGESRGRPCSCRRRLPSRSGRPEATASMLRISSFGRAPASQARSSGFARAPRISSSRRQPISAPGGPLSLRPPPRTRALGHAAGRGRRRDVRRRRT